MSWQEKYRRITAAAQKVWEKEKDWHPYFAWLPVRISDFEKVWLGWVQCKLSNPAWCEPNKTYSDWCEYRTYIYRLDASNEGT